MRTISNMVSMAITPKEITDDAAEMTANSPAAINVATDHLPKYPYGLCISLGNEEIEKLGLDISDAEVGDMVHLFCMAKLTSKSERDEVGGAQMRLELQITDIAVENENDENEAAEEEAPAARKKMGRARLYG